MNKKILFYIFWLVMLLVGPTAVILNSSFDSIIGNRILLTNFIQRILGTMAFGALTFQITLGSNIDYFRKTLGGSALRNHIINGIFAYTLVVIHPFMWVIINYFMRSKFDIYFPYVDVCLMCQSWNDWIYNFGRLAFWSLTIGVIAGLFRGYNKFMRLHWRKFHILNYVAFYFVSLHAYDIGTDSTTKLFSYFFWIFQVLVLFSIVRRIKLLTTKN